MIKLLTGLCLLHSASLFAAESRLLFDIYLDSSRIGSHQVVVGEQDGQKTVETQARMQVDFMFLTVFSYEHQAYERWQQDCLVQLDTSTNDDGEQLQVSARQAGNGLQVNTSQDSRRLDGCVRTFAYWNPSLLDSAYLLNTQNGLYEPVRLLPQGEQPLLFNNRAYGSRHYRLEVGEDVAIHLWYDDEQNWQALETRVAGDRVLRYLRREV